MYKWHQIETPIPQRHSEQCPMLSGYRRRVFNSSLDTKCEHPAENGPSFVTKVTSRLTHWWRHTRIRAPSTGLSTEFIEWTHKGTRVDMGHWSLCTSMCARSADRPVPQADLCAPRYVITKRRCERNLNTSIPQLIPQINVFHLWLTFSAVHTYIHIGRL